MHEASSFRAVMQVDVELLTASPESNGFFGSKGMSGFIPTAYSLLEHTTWARLTKQWNQSRAKQDKQVSSMKQLREYGRPGWEFHAKGIW